jgi:hypothetical protein
MADTPPCEAHKGAFLLSKARLRGPASWLPSCLAPDPACPRYHWCANSAELRHHSSRTSAVEHTPRLLPRAACMGCIRPSTAPTTTAAQPPWPRRWPRGLRCRGGPPPRSRARWSRRRWRAGTWPWPPPAARQRRRAGWCAARPRTRRGWCCGLRQGSRAGTAQAGSGWGGMMRQRGWRGRSSGAYACAGQDVQG